MKENIIQNKSYHFALKIIELYKTLSNDKREFILSKQLLRSGTSIGANIEEAIGGQSSRDFIHKMAIAYKESRETIYWLKLLRDSHYLLPEQANLYIKLAEEINKILSSIIKTSKSK